MPDQSQFEINILTTADTAGAAQTAEALGAVTAKTEQAASTVRDYAVATKTAEEAEKSAAETHAILTAQMKERAAQGRSGLADPEGLAGVSAAGEAEAKAAEEAEAKKAAAAEIRLATEERMASIQNQRINISKLETTILQAQADGEMQVAAIAERQLAIKTESLRIQIQTLTTEAEATKTAEIRVTAEAEIAANRAAEVEAFEARIAAQREVALATKEEAAQRKSDEKELRVMQQQDHAARMAEIQEEERMANSVMRGAGRAAGLGRNTGIAAAAGGDVLLAVIAIKEGWELVNHFINASREATEAFKKASHDAYAEAEKDARSLAEAQKKGMQQAKDEAEAYIKSLHEITQVSLQMENKLADSALKKKLSEIDLQEEKDLHEIVVDEGDTSKQGQAVIRAEAENKRAAAKQKAEQDRAQQEFSQADLNLMTTQGAELKLKKEAPEAAVDRDVKAQSAEQMRIFSENATAARKKAEEELKEANKKVTDSYLSINLLHPEEGDTVGLKIKAFQAQQKVDATKGEEEGAKADYKVANAQATLAASRAKELQDALEKVTKEVEDFKASVKVAKNNLDAIPAIGAKELEKVDKEGQEKIAKAIKDDAEALQKAADSITSANKQAAELLNKKDAREESAEEKWNKERDKANGAPSGAHHGAGAPAHHEGHGATDAHGAPAGHAKQGGGAPFDFDAAFHKHVGGAATADFNAAFGPDADKHQIDTRRSDVRQSAGREQNHQVDMAVGRANEALKGAASAPHNAEMDRVLDIVHKLADELISLKGQNKNDESHKPINSKMNALEDKVNTLISQTSKARGG